jgi:molybdopterin synthase sulfur carrier subunit
MIEILYFARIREELGTARERIPLPPGIGTARDLLGFLRRRGGPWEQALSPSASVLIAVNQVLARPETILADGDEIGIFPPVTGG